MNKNLLNKEFYYGLFGGLFGWKPVAAGIVSLLSFSAGSTPAYSETAKSTDHVLYLTNCGGEVYEIRLQPPVLAARHSVTELYDPPPRAPASCLLPSASMKGGMLALTVMVEDLPDPDDIEHRTLFVLPRDWKLISKSRIAYKYPPSCRPPESMGDLLEAAWRTGSGEDIQSYVHRGSTPDEIILVADRIGFAGDFGFANLLARTPDSSDIAVLQLSTNRVRVMAGAPRSFVPHMHPSSRGLRLLVEEVQGNSTEKAPARRTGRIAIYDSLSGRRTIDTVLPVLREPGVRTLCLSDHGTLVLGSSERGRIWILSGGRLHELAVPNDVSTTCLFD